MTARSAAARPNYALGLFTFGLLATTSIVHVSSVQAADAKSGWTVNRVASAASGSYCTMTQKYSDNTILTFAQNQNGEYSLAFDFAQPYFPGAKATTVSLRPAGGTAETFNVTPQSDKVIVVGIGKDEAFVGALKASGKFDLETAGKSHSYTTAKFDVAAGELAKCVASMKPSAAAPAVASAAHPASSPAPATIAATNAQDDGALIDLKNENAQLKDALAQSRKTYEDAQSNSQAAMASELQEKLGLLQKENEDLKAQKAAAPAPEQLAQQQQANAAAAQKIADTEKANADLKEQLNAANTTIGQLQAKSVAGTDQAVQLAALQKQNADIKAQLDAKTTAVAAAAASAVPADKLASLERQNSELQAQLSAANTTVGQLQAKSVAATDSTTIVASLQKENADLKAQLAAKPAAPTGNVADLEKQNKDLKTQLDASGQLITQLQAKTTAGDNTAQQLASLQKENADLQSQMKLHPALPVPAPGDQAQLAELKAENADLKQQLADAMAQEAKGAAGKGAKAAVVAGNDDTVKNLQNQLEMAQAENKSLKGQIGSMETASNDSQIKASGNNWDLEQATRRYQESQREIRRLSTLVDTQQVKCSQDKKDIEAKLFDPALTDKAQIAKFDEMQAHIAQLEQQVKNPGLAVAAAPDDNKQVAQLQKELADARADKDQLQQQVAAKAKQANPDDSKIAELEKKVADAQASQAKLADMQKQLDAANASKTQVVQLQQQLTTAQAAQSKVAQLEQQVQASQTAQTQLAQQANQSRAMQAKLDELEQKMKAVNTAPASGTEEAASQPPATKEIPVAAESLVPAASRPALPATSPVASAVVSPAVAVHFQSQQDFSRMLSDAKINTRGGVETVAGSNADTYRAYRWKTDSLFGSAEQRPVRSQESFDQAVNTYLTRAKTRCGGDFAAVPADVPESSFQAAKAYEIACIGGRTDTSASVLFTYDNNVMTTLAHEGKSAAMNMAMEARDRMASELSTMTTASR